MAAALETLVHRLEAAVARLEALDKKQQQEGNQANGVTFATAKTEIAAPPLSFVASTAAAAVEPTVSLAASVTDFDEIINNQVARVLSWGEKIGGKVLEVTKLLETAFNAERRILLMMTQCKPPGMQTLTSMIVPIGECIAKANALTEGKRTDTFNHLKAAADSMQALTWVVYTGKDCGMSMPTGHVADTWQAAEFYCNKVLVEFKSKDPNSVQWCRALKDLYLNALQAYVKRHHTTGPSWKVGGIDVSEFKEGGAVQAQGGGNSGQQETASTQSLSLQISPTHVRARAFGGGGGGAGSPSPMGHNSAPPPPSPLQNEKGETGGGGGNVFAELNKGEAVTKGLRKVSDDMKAKNRGDRSGVVVSTGPLPAAAESPTRGSSVRDAAARLSPPVFELVNGRKWTVEHQLNRRDLTITGHSRQSVYIFGCKGCLVRVDGKVNNITMDKCVRTSLVFQDVVAACEVVNCSGVEVQCQGGAQTFAIDNTSGCQLYISKNSLNAAITTAKSSEVNVLVPGTGGDFIEHHLPEQFMNTFQSGKFVTTPVDHTAG